MGRWSIFPFTGELSPPHPCSHCLPTYTPHLIQMENISKGRKGRGKTPSMSIFPVSSAINHWQFSLIRIDITCTCLYIHPNTPLFRAEHSILWNWIPIASAAKQQAIRREAIRRSRDCLWHCRSVRLHWQNCLRVSFNGFTCQNAAAAAADVRRTSISGHVYRGQNNGVGSDLCK